jgi:hypothetical protein
MYMFNSAYSVYHLKIRILVLFEVLGCCVCDDDENYRGWTE